MKFISKKPKISFSKRKRSKNGKEALQRLNSFLSSNQKEPVQILCGFWQDQQNAITYQELRMAVLEGYLDEKVFDQWAQDYSYMVTTQFEPIWTGAIKAGSLGQPIIDPVADKFVFDINSPGITEWIHNRGSFLVTNCTDTQTEAINFMLDAKIREQYDPGQLARMIRPCIGLTKGQTSAAKKIYDNTLEEQRKAHPRTKDSVLQQRALDKATKYAERAHRQRALTIAQTELAFAYNHGADQTIRQAQQHYLIGKCIKRWNTAGDDNVCPICEALDGTEVGMEETYNDGHKTGETVMLPPLHPRCACAIEYIEVEPPDISLMENENVKPDETDLEYLALVTDSDIIDSNDYSKRYTKLDEEMKVIRSVRNNAKDFVNHRSGTKGEDLAFISSENGKAMVNKSCVTEMSCVPTKQMMEYLKETGEYKMIGLHNHPTSGPPSIDDIMVAIERKYKYGIIAGHDGTIYKYEITNKDIKTSNISMPGLKAALSMAEREKKAAIIAGEALTKISDDTYNELMKFYVRLEVL